MVYCGTFMISMPDDAVPCEHYTGCTRLCHSLCSSESTLTLTLTLTVPQSVQFWIHSWSKTDLAFKAFLRNLEGEFGGLSVGAYLILPLQRAIQYGLLLERLLKYTRPEDVHYQALQDSFEELQGAQAALDSEKKRYKVRARFCMCHMCWSRLAALDHNETPCALLCLVYCAGRAQSCFLTILCIPTALLTRLAPHLHPAACSLHPAP